MSRLLPIIVFCLHCIFCNAQRTDSLIVSELRDNGVSFSNDNSAVLLMSGKEKFDDLFQAIRNAKSSVHLEYFNFRNDSTADALFTLLAEKAREGVEVRALFDGFGNKSNNRPLKKKHLKLRREQGIQIYEFNPVKFPWIDDLFGRDHRKIVVIDGKIGYTGGMNVADYYIKGTDVVGEWRDMHCRIEGAAVNELQDIFVRMWKKVTGEQISGAQYYRGENQKTPEYFTGLKPDTSLTAGKKMIGIINREPRRSPKIIRKFYISAINNAKDSIKIINPYFTLIPSVKKALQKAIERGVKVELMIAANSDIPLTSDHSFHNMHKLMKKGAQVWIYLNGFHHSKIMTVDGQVCTVGSSNLDARSLCFDYEDNAVVVDACTTKELDEMFNRDKHRSFRLTEESWKEWRTPWKRFFGSIAGLLAPLL
ncbi:MAG: phospholipase D-like domain-containing protein [Prevotella sp.]|uniref:phospholipase D-like domain-containing protein n=1 Tax=Prevotella sp. TaxID=59823 RepID=UPI002A2AE416|nr:phospholipase D-like domain-containing protein [Prevotella sp.]MDD7317881.1 phospholipase D-like domain-containing protein [Prevotellaceae bacterium]MDY4019670.1 phospholipase D-like domain-containing protein [Prevotella sp.]